MQDFRVEKECVGGPAEIRIQGNRLAGQPGQDGGSYLFSKGRHIYQFQFKGPLFGIIEDVMDHLFNLQGRYVGERQRGPQDPRSNMDDYFTVDATGTIFNLWITGLTLRAGLKNIFDADVRDPDITTFDFTGNVVPSYTEDLPRPGRRWWTGLSYDF